LSGVEERDGSWILTVEHPVGPEWITVPKGSIALSGISLTVVDSTPGRFSVAAVPLKKKLRNLGKKVGSLPATMRPLCRDTPRSKRSF